MLRLLLGSMFLGCFVIDEILVLITMEKSGLGLIINFREGNSCTNKLANL